MPAVCRKCCSLPRCFWTNVETLLQARAKLQQEDYQVVLTEAALPDGDWLDALHLARESPHEPEVIVTDPLADARFWARSRSIWAHTICWRSLSTSRRCAAS